MSNQSQSKKPSPTTNATFDPWLLWVAFRRHWAWVVPTGLVMATIASVVIFYTFVPEYEATQILQANQDFVLTKELVDSRDLARSERQLILSPVVLTEVLDDPKLNTVPSLSDPDTRKREIQKRIKISNGGSDILLLISYRDTDRKQVAKVASAIADSYVQERKRFDALRLKSILDSLIKPIERFEMLVKEDRKQLLELSEKHTGVNPFKASPDTRSSTSLLEKLLEKQFEFDVDLKMLNDQLASLESSVAQAGVEKLTVARERDIEAYVNEDLDVKELRARIAENEHQMRSIERKEKMSQVSMSTGLHRDLKRDVDKWNDELTKLVSETRTKVEEKLREEDKRRKQEAIEVVQSKIRSITESREKITAEFEKEKDRIGSMGGETTELYLLRERYDEHRDALKDLSARRIKLEAEQGNTAGSVILRSAATEPHGPLEETPIKKVAMVGGFFFFLPFFLALLIEFRAKRITSAESIDLNQLIPIIGEIARIPGGRKRTAMHRMFEESIDAMRANLLFKMENVKTIAVTSAMSGEGKSSVAFYLAHSISRCTGENVLVIDADLRSPDQHDLFGLEQGPGLCSLLVGNAMLDKCIDSNEGELVHLLSAGRLDTNPHNVLSKQNVERVLAQVSTRYRYIVVDTAPILPAAETLAITAVCDATLLCAMRDVSQSEHVKRTFRRLEDAGSKVIGTVFNGVPSRVYAARYGDYRYAIDPA